jgi:hypothetical protein
MTALTHDSEIALGRERARMHAVVKATGRGGGVLAKKVAANAFFPAQ